MEGGLPGESKDSSQGGLCPCPWDPVWGTCLPGRVLLTFLFSSVSDYVIDDKVAVLQKRDHEGFGFVLRGAKGNGAGYPAGKGCAPLGVSSVSCLCSSPLLSSCRAPAPLSSPPPASSPCCDSVFLVWDVGRRQRVLSLIGSQDLCCACLMERGPFWWGEWRGRGGSLRGVCPGFPGWLFSRWAAPACRPPAQVVRGRLLCGSHLHLDPAGRTPSLLPSSRPTAETPIEEFTPTPAFPALQYLESVDVEGVAWRAGLRTGDFLIEVRLVLPCVALWGAGLCPSPRRTHLDGPRALTVPGEWSERGEGRAQAGGGSDPPGREPPRHEGGVSDKEA